MVSTTNLRSTLTTPLFRPAADRFHSQIEWLDSWHSFSFGSHYDPAWMGFGPLRVINDDTIAAGKGFGMHPHRDMEIVTVMVEGELTHQDSMGNREVLRAGEVQRMSAGTGVVHSEVNASDRPCHLLQIWIEPVRLGIPPAYEQKPFAIAEGWTPLLSPTQDQESMAIDRPIRLWRAQPAPGTTLEIPIAAKTLGWIQLIDGAVTVESDAGASQTLVRGDGLGFSQGQIQRLTSSQAGTDLLVFELV
ncbi:pirin family protein [Synechococcus elongatus IITB4]|uniref:pirin family protein n=1 Tax=Synechococcus elongatus TaxID=32046 RepID=UPI0030D43AD3